MRYCACMEIKWTNTSFFGTKGIKVASNDLEDYPSVHEAKGMLYAVKVEDKSINSVYINFQETEVLNPCYQCCNKSIYNLFSMVKVEEVPYLDKFSNTPVCFLHGSMW